MDFDTFRSFSTTGQIINTTNRESLSGCFIMITSLVFLKEKSTERTEVIRGLSCKTEHQEGVKNKDEYPNEINFNYTRCNSSPFLGKMPIHSPTPTERGNLEVIVCILRSESFKVAQGCASKSSAFDRTGP
ncbi:hypothetical protein CEXT_766221 [Caerostris extrusa]|uniref:Uncharacterized protein n=1 Tax=Caerostris extrusa TaxID=172846 RepID=A0AAV4P036_CAEEX|nr:hypothetical protein CEXT_766221 [Caerostris extrusa]